MAEPRKVPFVTISSFNSSTTPETKKRRREDEAEITSGKDGGGGSSGAVGSGGCGAPFGNVKGSDTEPAEPKPTVRLTISLSEPSEQGSAEFNYSELVQSSLTTQVKPAASPVPKGLMPSLDPSDPFADDERERLEVEALAKKFESKYGGVPKKKKRDRMQDLIDIGYGYDDTDPFIDNSEAYDELVPASLTTKHGGFYINTGTLQFRPASDSEGEEHSMGQFEKMKDGEEHVMKKRKKKPDGNGTTEDKKPKKNRLPKPGVSGLTIHRPEKKKRKKLMKDSLNLANMLRRFTREKEEMRKKNPASVVAGVPRPPQKAAPANSSLLSAPKAPGTNDFSMADLAADPTVMSLLGHANNNDMLQDMMGDLDFTMLDSPQPSSPGQGENGSMAAGHKPGGGGGGRLSQGSVLPPPPLPSGLPAPLIKRIEDLRAASRQFDQEGRKKFFTLDMNNILLDIELQVQEQPVAVRASVYSHLEAFVPCNKEALLKRLKKLSLNIQDDRLRTPLLKLKLAVCSVMPEQIARYNMDCIAKVAKQQSEEGDKNGSEDDDEEKPGKRVMGPRKKFIWDDKLRLLLCTLVRVKLSCYELESQNSLSLEDYLKAFMETEVKPLWPKGWMQARMLFKESAMVHGHLTGNAAKKKIVTTPKAKPKEVGWVQRPTPSPVATPSPAGQVAKRPAQSLSEPIYLDATDEDLTAPSLDSISQALAILSSTAKGLAQGDSPPSPERPKMAATSPSPSLHCSPMLLQQQQHKKMAAGNPSGSGGPLYAATSARLPTLVPVPSKALPQAHRHPLLVPQRPPAPSPAKPRPPPTASPLLAPGSKPGLPALPGGHLKGGNNTKEGLYIASPHARGHAVPTLSHVTPKAPQAPRLPLAAHGKPSLLSSAPHPHPPPPQQQSNFITPMQATLTKSSHSSTPPIIKLTPRTPNTIPAATAVTSAPAPPPLPVSSHPRSQATPSVRQYAPKPPAGFRPPFSGAQGAQPKLGQGQGIYSLSGGGHKTPISISISSSTNAGLINTSSISKHSGSSPSPAAAQANAGQRQRSVGGNTQGAKPITSISSPVGSSQLTQVSAAGGGGLLGTPASLPLGYGMLGGLVPVSLPFQYPSLLNMPTLGTVGAGTGAGGSAASSSTVFSTLTQNLYKSLQSGSQVALPPHLQFAFSDVNQSQGGDAKRKTL